MFPFFTNPMELNNVFEGFFHPLIFGGLLIPFFLGRLTTSSPSADSPRAAPGWGEKVSQPVTSLSGD